MKTAEKGTVRLSEIIIKSLSRILKLQSVVAEKECESNIVKRGIDRNVILKRNVSINCITSDLLTGRFSDRDEVLSFQHFMYRNMMDIELKRMGREITSLNAIIAKERRILKAITTDEVFKSCHEFIKKRKTDEMISWGSDNEVTWKRALLEKDKQEKSIDEWLKMVDTVFIDKCCGDTTVSGIFDKIDNLSMSEMTTVSYFPCSVSDEDMMLVDYEIGKKFDKPTTSLNRKNDVLESRDDSSIKSNGAPPEIINNQAQNPFSPFTTAGQIGKENIPPREFPPKRFEPNRSPPKKSPKQPCNEKRLNDVRKGTLNAIERVPFNEKKRFEPTMNESRNFVPRERPYERNFNGRETRRTYSNHSSNYRNYRNFNPRRFDERGQNQYDGHHNMR